ncbi:MAG TPA: helix-turn-helix domain-containing protein [Acidimicrobiales bacterium]|jgi:transcriptional regulator with XRE-family HTH domain
MTSVQSPPRGAGELLREWRQRRRRSQLDLSIDAQVSARHLSFVETGRSKPSRELLLHLAEHLDVPLRERNTLLLAAGYSPLYPERSMDDAAMAPVREALDLVLAGHEPFPALVVDRHWNLVSANGAAFAFLTDVAPELLEPPTNALRLSLHPDGLAQRILNLAEYSAHVLHRLQQQAVLSQDAELEVLYDELRGYPGVEETSPAVFEPAAMVFSPLRVRGPDGQELAFFSTLATFGSAVDITMAELLIESFFPADPTTSAALGRL